MHLFDRRKNAFGVVVLIDLATDKSVKIINSNNAVDQLLMILSYPSSIPPNTISRGKIILVVLRKHSFRRRTYFKPQGNGTCYSIGQRSKAHTQFTAALQNARDSGSLDRYVHRWVKPIKHEGRTNATENGL